MTRLLYEYRSFTLYQLRRMLDGEPVSAPRDVSQIARLRESLDAGFRVHTIVNDTDFVLLERAVEADEPIHPEDKLFKTASRFNNHKHPFGRSRKDVGVSHEADDFDSGQVVMYMPNHSSGTTDPVNEWGIINGATMSNFVFVSFKPKSTTSVDARMLLKPEDLWPNENVYWKSKIEAAVDLHRAAT